MKNFYETDICKTIGEIMVGRNYGWNDKGTEVTIKTLMEGFSVYLGRNKSKDNPVAVELVDVDGKFHFGMWVEHVKDDDNEEGSWKLNMTFEESTMDRNNWTITNYPDDPVLVGIVQDVGYTNFGAHYKFAPKDANGKICEGSPQELFCTCVDCIVDYLRANVAIDPELEMSYYFSAVAKLEADGSVYIEAKPSNNLQQHIKDDKVLKSTEVAA